MKTVSRFSTWEAHLIERASAGESVAFELIVDQYRPVLMSLATKMLRNQDDAMDVVQETLIRAHRNIKDFDSSRPIKPWLCRICANCCIDLVRERKRGAESLEPYEYMLVAGGPDLEDATAERLEANALMNVIGKLPTTYRRILEMRHLEHMDVNEIAFALGKPEGTIKSWLFRARAMVRRDLAAAVN